MDEEELLNTLDKPKQWFQDSLDTKFQTDYFKADSKKVDQYMMIKANKTKYTDFLRQTRKDRILQQTLKKKNLSEKPKTIE